MPTTLSLYKMVANGRPYLFTFVLPYFFLDERGRKSPVLLKYILWVEIRNSEYFSEWDYFTAFFPLYGMYKDNLNQIGIVMFCIFIEFILFLNYFSGILSLHPWFSVLPWHTAHYSITLFKITFSSMMMKKTKMITQRSKVCCFTLFFFREINSTKKFREINFTKKSAVCLQN